MVTEVGAPKSGRTVDLLCACLVFLKELLDLVYSDNDSIDYSG